MNVSYRWLQACVSVPIGSPAEIAERLAARGFPIEGRHDLSAGLEDIVVARVDEVRPHPDADRLTVCVVEAGKGPVQVVCGAPNVEAGGWYPFAPVGASLPTGARIRKVKLRGQTSEGMLCSERELGLGADEEGLLILQGGFEPGDPLIETLGLGDERLAVEVTANRPDMLSHLGVARELAIGGNDDLRFPELPLGEGIEESVRSVSVIEDPAQATGGGVTIRIADGDLCLRYLGLALSGVRIQPSPPWMQSRLRAIGARPINNVVDATNYVLHECGQPLHAFDLQRLRERTVVVRRADEGESIVTLDGEKRALSSEMLAICDSKSPVAVAGVMGGAESEVSDATEEVLLECALFQPGSVRSTRKALGLSTDASYRFERGVDPETMRRAIERTAELVLATAGGRLASPLLDVCPIRFARERITLRLSRVGTLLGVPFEASTVRALLEPLGLGVDEIDGDEDTLRLEVPGFRSYDLTREVDFIEEIARTHGYDTFPERLGSFRPGSVPDHPLFALEDSVRDALTASGLLEAQTPAFTSADHGEVEIVNPISTEDGFLRSRLLPGLKSRLEYNLRRGNRDVRLFEIGTVFHTGAGEGPPEEETRVAAILHGSRSPPHWSHQGEPIDLWDLKALYQRLVAEVSHGEWKLQPGIETHRGAVDYTAGAGLSVVDEHGGVKGMGGRLLDEGLDLPPWAGDVWGFELQLPSEPPSPQVPVFEPMPVHEGVERDLALLVPAEVQVESALSLIAERGGEELRDVEVFDVYRGAELPGQTRSVAVRLRFRAFDRTLKDEEVEHAVGAVVRALQEELSVGIRGKSV